MTTARSHQAAGIRRAISEPVFPKDIISDVNLALCDIKTFGAWMMTLLYIWDGKTDRLTNTMRGWAKIWRCSLSEAHVIMQVLIDNNPCRVEMETQEGAKVITGCFISFHETVGNAPVTLVSRRLEKRLRYITASTKRVQNFRKRKCNGPVTHEKRPLSISSSSSPSTSVRGGEETPPFVEPAWARKRAARDELDRLRLKPHPTAEEVELMRRLKAVISECNRETAGVK